MGAVPRCSDPGHYIEHLIDDWWAEYVRRNERVSSSYIALREQKLAFHVLEAPPVVRRFVPEADAPDAVTGFLAQVSRRRRPFHAID